MEKETIVNGNRLIAEFMGAVVNPKWQDETTYTYTIAPSESSSYHWTPDTMRYHESWEWLMPVVEKIESLEKVDYTILYAEHKNIYQFEINLKYDTDSTFNVITENKIESIYTCVVEFIEWYNKNK